MVEYSFFLEGTGLPRVPDSFSGIGAWVRCSRAVGWFAWPAVEEGTMCPLRIYIGDDIGDYYRG